MNLISIFGYLAVVCYFFHLFIGQRHYPNYNFRQQAVSGLTAIGAPSRKIAALYANLYAFLSSIFCILLTYHLFQRDMPLSLLIGSCLLTLMCLTSAIGYALFPLKQKNTELALNKGHLMTTIFVVISTILGLVFFTIGFWFSSRPMAFLSLTTFILLMIGGILTQKVPKKYFGLAERLNAFSTVIYLAILATWLWFN